MADCKEKIACVLCVIVVTDCDLHAMWLCRTVDRYDVVLPESAEYLAGIGVPREKLHKSGILSTRSSSKSPWGCYTDSVHFVPETN